VRAISGWNVYGKEHVWNYKTFNEVRVRIYCENTVVSLCDDNKTSHSAGLLPRQYRFYLKAEFFDNSLGKTIKQENDNNSISFFKWSHLGSHYLSVYLYQLLYMFRATVWPSSGELTVSMWHWYFSLCMGGCLVCRPESHPYQCRIDKVSSPDDGHIVARNMYRSWNK